MAAASGGSEGFRAGGLGMGGPSRVAGLRGVAARGCSVTAGQPFLVFSGGPLLQASGVRHYSKTGLERLCWGCDLSNEYSMNQRAYIG